MIKNSGKRNKANDHHPGNNKLIILTKQIIPSSTSGDRGEYLYFDFQSPQNNRVHTMLRRDIFYKGSPMYQNLLVINEMTGFYK